MNKKKLIKQIEKHYWANGQTLIIDTWEMMTNDDNDDSFEVFLANTDISLFTIQNYNALTFNDSLISSSSYFKEPKHRFIDTWDGVKASCTPLYLDRVITLNKFKPITKEDIINATNYFIREVLGLWLIFDIKFKEEKIQNDESISYKLPGHELE